MPEFVLPGRNDPRFQGLDAFTQAYIEAAIFTDEEQLGGTGTVAFQQLAPRTLASMVFDCARFQRRAQLDTLPDEAVKRGSVIEQAGHDFWMTRNGHGVGFWDGDWREPYADTLDRLAHSFGEVYLYRGDDGAIHS